MEELTPRQSEFLKNYLNPKSDTFSNAYQSAIKAGFSEEYSKTILSQDLDWLSENLRDNNLIIKALKNLDILLEGEDMKVRADLTKFVLERLNKKKFSQRIDNKLTVDKPIPILYVQSDNSNKEDTTINQEN